MSDDFAWICDSLDFAYAPMSVEVPENLNVDSPVVAASGLHRTGLPYDETAFEAVAKWDKSPGGYAKTLPHVFKCNGFTGVSAKAREVFVAHDMGKASFRPLQLYEADGVTPYSGQLYLLNFGAQKQAFRGEDSPLLQRAFTRGDVRKLPFLEQRVDDQVVLDRKALTGADLWTDPLLYRGVFVSDRLHDAMVKARVDKPFHLSRCVIAG